MAAPPVYKLDPASGVLVGTEPAVQSPLDPPGTWLVPAHATLTPPPAVAAGRVPVWSGSSWSTQPASPTATAPATPPDATLAHLQALVMTAGATVSGQLVSEILPTPTDQVAYQNMAGIIAASGGSVPTSGPYAAMFAPALAQFPGLTPAAFAAMVVALTSASIANQAALATLRSSAAAAKSAAQLSAAVYAFELAVHGIVVSINAVAPVQIAPPPAIDIPGIT